MQLHLCSVELLSQSLISGQEKGLHVTPTALHVPPEAVCSRAVADTHEL